MIDWPEWAKLDARVVLVDGSGGLTSSKLHLEGSVFVIIERSDDFSEPAVRVQNLKTGDCNGPWEFGKLSRYRPLVSKTESEDLAVFRRIADLAGVDEALRRLEGVE